MGARILHPPGSVAGIVPAAGASRRMGSVDKRLLPHRGRALLEHAVRALLDGGAHPVVVVLEPRSPCAGLPALRAAVRVVNPRPEGGMLSSIRAGLAAVPPAAAAAAILPGDNPFVPAEAVRSLLAAFHRARPPLLLPRYGGRRGHPLLLRRDLFAAALACDDRVGLRQLVRARPGAVRELCLPHPRAALDIDRPEDIGRLAG